MIKKERKLKIKKEPEIAKRCLARIGSGTQCTREFKGEGIYCGPHMKYAPFGQYGGALEGKFMKRKRGRKCSEEVKEIDSAIYIETQVIQINEKDYMIDKCGILYSNDSNCNIIGHLKRNEEGDYITWFC